MQVEIEAPERSGKTSRYDPAMAQHELLHCTDAGEEPAQPLLGMMVAARRIQDQPLDRRTKDPSDGLDMILDESLADLQCGAWGVVTTGRVAFKR